MTNNTSRASANLAMLEFVAHKLGDLANQFVFLGGCATALFITDLAAPDVRPTLDVDCIVDVLSLGQYHQLEKQLIKKGFKKSLEDEVICRWHYDEIILDVIPTDEKILGFGNQWYKASIAHAITHQLTEKLFIKSVTAPYFLATKLEAFKTRGKKDFLASHDFEDIITVIDGRIELTEEVINADHQLKNYLTQTFSDILQDRHFHAAIPGILNYGSLTNARTEIILNRIKKMVNKE